jgi:predicted MFS family arabinose efflux permease
VALTLVALVPIARPQPGPDDVESETTRADAPESPAPGAGANAQPLKATALLRMGSFWTIGMSSALTLGVTQAVMITLVPLAQDTGIGSTQAASLISVLATAGFVGNLLLAWIADRVDRMRMLCGLFIAIGLVNGLLLFSHDYLLFVTCAALLGFAAGIVSPAFHTLIADRFGPASFGTAYGLMTPLLAITAALCARYAGEVFDRTGGYDFLFLSFIASQAFAALLMWSTRMLATREALSARDLRTPIPSP